MTGKKVAVALSGGVDSAVAAALLKKEGHAVIGLFARGWSAPGIPCDWRREADDAARVAAHLRIPFREIDLGDAYEREVVRPMLAAYRLGRTPNPDVWCNRRIKFGLLADAARALGAEFLATGHYARIETSPKPAPPQTQSTYSGFAAENNSQFRLRRGVDTSKDQSYFLWTLTQSDLARTLFPLGSLEKREVRRLAREFKLPNAEKPDSQGLCFVGELDLKDFLRHELKPAAGAVLDERGREVGRHDGAVLYTPGERAGFDISEPTLRGAALFVTRIDAARGTVTVSGKPPQISDSPATLVLSRSSETRLGAFAGAATCLVRYRGEPLRVLSANFPERIELASCPVPVAAGQSAVLYSADDKCLGGGDIESASGATPAYVR